MRPSLRLAALTYIHIICTDVVVARAISEKKELASAGKHVGRTGL